MTLTPRPGTRDDPTPQTVTVWALLDAHDLVSLHATEDGARDAREAHLVELGPWCTEDQDLLEAATQIVSMPLQT